MPPPRPSLDFGDRHPDFLPGVRPAQEQVPIGLGQLLPKEFQKGVQRLVVADESLLLVVFSDKDQEMAAVGMTVGTK